MKMPIPAGPEPILSPIRTKHPSDQGCIISFRRLSHDIPTTTDASSDVYYRENRVGVPFLWESQPGTPKIKSREFSIPPLTPPPSFHSSPGFIPQKRTKNSIVSAALILPRLNLVNKKGQFQRSPSSRSSSSSLSSPPWSSPSSFGTPNESKQRRIRSTPPRMSCDSRAAMEESDEFESPVSSLCFGIPGRGGGRPRRGCSSSIMKLLMRDF